MPQLFWSSSLSQTLLSLSYSLTKYFLIWKSWCSNTWDEMWSSTNKGKVVVSLFCQTFIGISEYIVAELKWAWRENYISSWVLVFTCKQTIGFNLGCQMQVKRSKRVPLITSMPSFRNSFCSAFSLEYEVFLVYCSYLELNILQWINTERYSDSWKHLRHVNNHVVSNIENWKGVTSYSTKISL